MTWSAILSRASTFRRLWTAASERAENADTQRKRTLAPISKQSLCPPTNLRCGAAAVRTPHDWSEWIVRGLSRVVKLLSPDLIIIGGSVGSMFPSVPLQIRAALRGEDQTPRIEMSEFGREGPTFGAALRMRQRILSVDERAATRAALCAS